MNDGDWLFIRFKGGITASDIEPGKEALCGTLLRREENNNKNTRNLCVQQEAPSN